MAYWQEHSLGLAPQVSGFGTANSTDADYRYIMGDPPKVTFETEIQELELMTGQIGAAPERLVGRRGGTFSFSMPLEGLKSGYDPTAENPGDVGVLPYWFCLLGNIVGSQIALSDTAAKFWKGDHLSNSAYTAGGMASGTAGTIVCDNATASNKILAGELAVAAASASTTTVQFGFVKTKAVQTLTLFENAQHNVNSAAAHLYGTSTAWIGTAFSSQLPMTARWVGENATLCYVLQDCICTGWKATWDSGGVGTIEFTFKFYDYSVDKTKGGLQVPDGFTRVPQLVGSVNGRATINGAEFDGLDACTLEYKVEVKEIKSHSASQGIAAVSYRKPRISASFSLPHQTGDLVYDAAGGAGNTGSHVWQSYLERGVSVSVGCYVGSQVGRLWAFLIPAGKIVSVPAVADRDGAIAYTLNVEAGAYTGDSTDTAETSSDSPIDSLFRTAVG